MDDVRIGIGAVVLDGAVVEEGAQVGAGALVPPGKVVAAGWLVMGVPAKPIRLMSAAELDDIKQNALDYLALWHRDYRGRWNVHPSYGVISRSTIDAPGASS